MIHSVSAPEVGKKCETAFNKNVGLWIVVTSMPKPASPTVDLFASEKWIIDFILKIGVGELLKYL